MYSRIICLYIVFVASVIVQSNAGIPPLDEETILFLEDKMVLGKVIKFSHNLHSARHQFSVVDSLSVAYCSVCRFYLSFLCFHK